MPTGVGSSTYRRALLDSRSRAVVVGRRANSRLINIFAESLKQIVSRAPDGDASDPRAQALARQVRIALSSFEQQFAQLGKTSIEEVIASVRAAHMETLARAATTADVTLANVQARFSTLRSEVISTLADARGASEFRSLIRYRLDKQAIAQIDSFVYSRIALGTAPLQTAKDLAVLMARNSPEVLDELGPRIANAAEITSADLVGTRAARTIFYDARMIVISETNNTLRASNAIASVNSGIVAAMKWTTGSNHSERDICDEIAEEDVGFGAGYYPPDHEVWTENVTHPHCACYAGDVITLDPSEWK